MSHPIADYALLSDRHRAALVSRAGSVDWLCAPRFDSPAAFGRLLDPEAGHWSIEPTGPYEPRRAYADGSLVLRTTFQADEGEATLTDALATGPNEGGHALGMEAPGALLRRVECTRGRIRLAFGFSPRPEYGLVHPVLEPCEGGVRSRGGPLSMVLSSPVELEGDGSDARAELELEEGETLHFALHFRPAWSSGPRVWAPDETVTSVESLVQRIGGHHASDTTTQNEDGFRSHPFSLLRLRTPGPCRPRSSTP